MFSWQFAVALLATAISISNLTRITLRNHVSGDTRTLSELAAGDRVTLTYFRIILWVCASLFALSLYSSLSHFDRSLLISIGSALMIGGEVLLAWLPAKGKTVQLHNVLGIIMSAGMLMLAYLFANVLHGGYQVLAISIAGFMSLSGVLIAIDRKRFLFYELLFIYLSHISIALALFAVT